MVLFIFPLYIFFIFTLSTLLLCSTQFPQLFFFMYFCVYFFTGMLHHVACTVPEQKTLDYKF